MPIMTNFHGLIPAMAVPFRADFSIDEQELTFVGNQTYETIFCPRWDGRLYLMVNDAAPLLSHYFYNNNRGGAFVSIAPAPEKRCR